MAKNPNESRENKHTLALGISGAGKTYWLANHPWIKKRGVRKIIWDPYESHHTFICRSRSEFAKELKQALASGKGYSIGLAIHPSPKAFEWFCACVWASLDGRKETIILIEELADVAQPGKAGPNWGQLIRVGRKYGAVIMAATQRPQEIDKTLFTQVSRIWAGLVCAYDRVYVEKYLGLNRGAMGDIAANSYKFVYVHGTDIRWGGPKMKKIKY